MPGISRATIVTWDHSDSRCWGVTWWLTPHWGINSKATRPSPGAVSSHSHGDELWSVNRCQYEAEPVSTRPHADPGSLGATCSVTGSAATCDLGDVPSGTTRAIGLQVEVPLTTTGKLHFETGVVSDKIDFRLANNTLERQHISAGEWTLNG